MDDSPVSPKSHPNSHPPDTYEDEEMRDADEEEEDLEQEEEYDDSDEHDQMDQDPSSQQQRETEQESRTPRETRKDKDLKTFLNQMDKYAPIVCLLLLVFGDI
jgi:hypothetical protein